MHYFEYLDGYRGLLALIVACAHTIHYSAKSELVNFLNTISQSVGVYGFFVLSSFLLTYRLLKQLKQFKQNSILNYFIRRFFHVYVPFFIYATLAKFGPRIIGGHINYHEHLFYSSWTSLVSLNTDGSSHLWTIAPEIKYYFIIPIICLICLKLGNKKILFVTAAGLWLALDEKFNFFGLGSSDLDIKKRHVLLTRYAVFLYGSMAAVVLDIIEDSKAIVDFLKKNQVQFLINYSSLFVSLIGVRYKNHHLISEFYTSGKIWSSVILLVALSNEENFLKKFFCCSLLKNCGKYSFGIYILHPIFIQTTQYYAEFEMQLDFTVLVLFQSYLAAVLFNKYIELNCIKLGNKFKHFFKI
ncbi:acyltransferase family [Brachionus plicatilis]|uniref:Acyltransferase family n=1 Tax=Brachionus plicatilis TaxID=10195 RepID=A0A3M7P9R6_BRAPC|nr:acyltransferase family [Brachionus plicatilis]